MDKKTGIIIGVWIACILTAVTIIVFAMRVPVYATVTDGEICGYDTETTTEPSTSQFKQCENPNKVDHYGKTRWVDSKLGPIPVPNHEKKNCVDMKTNFEREMRTKITWTDMKSSATSAPAGFPGMRMYTYKCTALAQWEPVYTVERWEGCGEEPAITTTFDVPKTCVDKSKETGKKWRWQ